MDDNFFSSGFGSFNKVSTSGSSPNIVKAKKVERITKSTTTSTKTINGKIVTI